jgi:hypothetical protein
MNAIKGIPDVQYIYIYILASLIILNLKKLNRVCAININVQITNHHFNF